jgi:transposase
VFTNTQRNRLKILHWDGTGLWVCAKRLEKGRFSWPSPPQDLQGGKVRLTAAGLAMLLGGLDFAQARLKDWRRENE